MNKGLYIIALYILTAFQMQAQSTYPQDYFSSPLDIKIILSGTFAELRSNHFHSGIDIKTQGVEGKNVYASAAGYVSRIKVSPYGFGKALYIKHPNGYTTVYAHLQCFNDSIDAYVKRRQYKKEKFAQDIYLTENTFKVKKREVIALSGNSGGSGGPHLHFEIRDQAQRPMNALMFGIKVTDNIAPKVKKLRIYPLNKIAQVNTSCFPKTFSLKKVGTYYMPVTTDTLELSGNMGFGLSTIDLLNGANNNNGIYSLELLLDGKRQLFFNVDKFGFDRTRFINSLIDYNYYDKHGIRFYKCWKQANNQLHNYHGMVNRGILSFNDNQVHEVKIISRDYAGNKSVVKFPVKAVKNTKECREELPSDYQKQFQYAQANVFFNKQITFNTPTYAFYEDFGFTYHYQDVKTNAYSGVHHIGNTGVPIQKKCNLSIACDLEVSKKHQSKLLICRKNSNGVWVSEGGSYMAGRVSAKIRNFGAYRIQADTVKPKIKAVDVYANKNVKAQKSISFTISDNLSGIKYYKVKANGKWLLFDYDAKTNKMTYEIDKKLPKGKVKLEVIVCDEKNNRTVKYFNVVN